MRATTHTGPGDRPSTRNRPSPSVVQRRPGRESPRPAPASTHTDAPGDPGAVRIRHHAIEDARPRRARPSAPGASGPGCVAGGAGIRRNATVAVPDRRDPPRCPPRRGSYPGPPRARRRRSDTRATRARPSASVSHLGPGTPAASHRAPATGRPDADPRPGRRRDASRSRSRSGGRLPRRPERPAGHDAPQCPAPSTAGHLRPRHRHDEPPAASDVPAVHACLEPTAPPRGRSLPRRRPPSSRRSPSTLPVGRRRHDEPTGAPKATSRALPKPRPSARATT